MSVTKIRAQELSSTVVLTVHSGLDCVWNVMAHAQKPDFVFRRNGRIHLNRRGVSVQSTAGSRGVRISGSNAGYTMFRGSGRVLATHSIRQFPLHFPSRASPCGITFQLDSTTELARSGCTFSMQGRQIRKYKESYDFGLCINRILTAHCPRNKFCDGNTNWRKEQERNKSVLCKYWRFKDKYSYGNIYFSKNCSRRGNLELCWCRVCCYRWINSITSLAFCLMIFSASLATCLQQLQINRDKVSNNDKANHNSSSDS